MQVLRSQRADLADDATRIPPEALHTVLTAQFGFERAQRLRHDLFVVLAPASAGVWVLAMWPEAVPSYLASTLLGGWWMLFATALGAGAFEGYWRQRVRLARRNLSAGNETGGKDEAR